VSVSSNKKQNKNTECRQYATERFHGSLRYGLSPILAFRESRELSGNQSGHILKKMECHFLSNLLISAELLFFCSFSSALPQAIQLPPFR
jgi:hypothetical protein